KSAIPIYGRSKAPCAGPRQKHASSAGSPEPRFLSSATARLSISPGTRSCRTQSPLVPRRNDANHAFVVYKDDRSLGGVVNHSLSGQAGGVARQQRSRTPSV